MRLHVGGSGAQGERTPLYRPPVGREVKDVDTHIKAPKAIATQCQVAKERTDGRPMQVHSKGHENQSPPLGSSGLGRVTLAKK